MMRHLLVPPLLLVVSCSAASSHAIAQNAENAAPATTGLVAVEFGGSQTSMARLATEAASLGWRIDVRTERSLRILPPANYDPDRHFGPLLERIEAAGLNDIGIRLIGPNGPIGPDD